MGIVLLEGLFHWIIIHKLTISFVILECVPGYEPSGSGCSICPVGSYKGTLSNDNCTLCDPVSETTDGTGKLSDSDCSKCIFWY